jgi:hypothetical protein
MPGAGAGFLLRPADLIAMDLACLLAGPIAYRRGGTERYPALAGLLPFAVPAGLSSILVSF